MNERPMTEGEWRVGTKFNPSGNDLVDEIKTRTAELIDLTAKHGQYGRCAALAQAAFEEAAMWAVKSVTKTKP